MPGLTPFQTLGPFFDFGLVLPDGGTIATPAAAGRHIVVEGTVRDGAGDVLPESTPIPPIGSTRRVIPPATASAVCRPTSSDDSCSPPCCLAGYPGRTARCRRRIWRSAFWLVAFSPAL
jgi:hypothetical protein